MEENLSDWLIAKTENELNQNGLFKFQTKKSIYETNERIIDAETKEEKIKLIQENRNYRDKLNNKIQEVIDLADSYDVSMTIFMTNRISFI